MAMSKCDIFLLSFQNSKDRAFERSETKGSKLTFTYWLISKPKKIFKKKNYNSYKLAIFFFFGHNTNTWSSEFVNTPHHKIWTSPYYLKIDHLCKYPIIWTFPYYLKIDHFEGTIIKAFFFFGTVQAYLLTNIN